jgi:hypothetical protein
MNLSAFIHMTGTLEVGDPLARSAPNALHLEC